MKPFTALRVIEVGGSLAGAYCAKIFSDHGATVIRVGGDSLTEAQRIYAHQGKQHATSPTDAMLLEADVLIESEQYGPLALIRVPEGFGGVRLQISAYGSSGPAATWRATDATLYAHSGHTHLTGDPDREPLAGAPHQPSYAAGLFGFIGVMGALFDLGRNNRLHVVEVSHFEALVALHQMSFMRYQLGNDVLRRMGNRWTGQGQPNGLYECADGWIAISAPTDPQVEMLLLVAGLTDLLEHPDIGSPMDFQTHPEILDGQLGPWLKSLTTDEAAEILQTVRVPAAPARPMLGLLDDAQLDDRRFWQEAEGRVVPRSPFAFSNATGEGGALRDGDPHGGPLRGVRVLDLAKVWAGPLAARLLAELGAEVIQVESPWNRGPQQLPESVVQAARMHPNNVQGPAQWNRNGHLIKYGLNKKSVVLDLTAAGGLDAFERLVGESDVVIENFSTRVMPQLGVDEHRLHDLNPGLVYMTMPGYGRSGPAENWVAYGTTVDSHAGLSHLIGYPNQVPWKSGTAWPDPIAGLHAASAMLIALWQRPVNGGVTIEIAQFESTVAMVGDALVEAQMRGDDVPVYGNRHPDFAPQGIYPSSTPDCWVVLSVHDDESWRVLCQEACLPIEWAGYDLEARRSAHDEIDAGLGTWTADFDAVELAAHLQGLGVAAAPELDVPGVMGDAQLAARGGFVEINQPQVGRFLTPRMPVRFSGTPQPALRHAALLGEHNDEVLTDVAGLTRAEIAALVDAGIVATEPPE